MKIKVLLVRLFTIQGVRDEMLATADGVEYVSKGGSSLTVITRSKSLNQSNSMVINSENSMATPGGGMRMKSSGELKVEDDGDQYYYQEVLGG
jgi:hypothetical protein